MAEPSQKPLSPPGAAAGDIIFECPYCEKSLAIDPRGAGMNISCPDCNRKIQVPGLRPEERQVPVAPPVVGSSVQDPREQVRILTEELAMSRQKVERLVASLEEIRERRRYLEKLRAENISYFEAVAKEMGLIQNAVDRVLTFLQDAAAEKSVPVPPGYAPADEEKPAAKK